MYFAELFFFEEMFCKPENFSDDALSLLQRLMADFVLVKHTWPTARSDLLFGADGSSVHLGYHQQHIFG
jgi:hypothetical protein